MGPKKNPADRRCIGDYHDFNSRTIPDRYSQPHAQDFTADLDGATIFSKTGFFKAYRQIPATDAIPATSIVIAFSLLEYLHMPFALQNAAKSQQCFVDNVTRGLPFVYAYIDDFLVASISF